MSASRSPDFAKLWSGYTIAVIGLRTTLFASAVIAAVAFVYLLASPVRRYRHPEPETAAA